MRKSVEAIQHMVQAVEYPKPLPAELKEYHVYISDTGHALMCVLDQHLDLAINEGVENYEIPVPVKYVLEKGYKVLPDCIVVGAEYHKMFGLMVDEEYEEF